MYAINCSFIVDRFAFECCNYVLKITYDKYPSNRAKTTFSFLEKRETYLNLSK
jgi:hypothetical protein